MPENVVRRFEVHVRGWSDSLVGVGETIEEAWADAQPYWDAPTRAGKVASSAMEIFEVITYEEDGWYIRKQRQV